MMNMRPKILSLGYALPQHLYTQSEVFSLLRYPKHFWRIFRESGIDQRFFCLELSQLMNLTFQEQQDWYTKLAAELSYQAVKECLDAGQSAKIGCLAYATCTGFPPGPTMAHYLGCMLELPPTVFYTNIASHGCESAFPGLRRAYDFVAAEGQGKLALAVNCELTSLTFWPEPAVDPENDYEVLRANAIFADAASACLVGYDDNWRHPEIIDMQTYTNFDYINDLGYIWREGRLRVKLSKRVPELAPSVVKPALRAVLARQKLSVNDITWWIIHAAGSAVLDNIRDSIGIPEEEMALSRETLRSCGNTSSTSVAITGKHLMSQGVKQGDIAMVLSVGPGMTGGCTCLRFGVT